MNARVHRPTSGEAGFTLVELMVALALAAMISVSIMFISQQARLAYDGTIKKVDVYNRFRFALKTIESDIRNWIPTSDLEFYADGRGKSARVNLHWDPGEELPDRKDTLGPGVVDGGTYGDIEEFAYIIERHYLSKEPLQFESKRHDAYQLYFRTLAFIDGALRVANVEYMLVDPAYAENNDGQPSPDRAGPLASLKIPPPPRVVKPENVASLSLFKIVRYYDLSYKCIKNPNETFITRKVIEVCPNVTDFKLEYMVDRSFRGRASAGFRTPEEDFQQPSEQATQPRHDPKLGTDGGYRKNFGYGSMKLKEDFERATAFPAKRGDDRLRRVGSGEHTPTRFGFMGNPKITFNELVPGDKIFVFTSASRGEQAQQGAAAGTAGNISRFTNFPAGDYTVKTNLEGLLEFEEDFDTTTWNGQPKNNIYYKVGFLPAAVRVTLRVVDDDGQNPKTLQREVWLRRRSR